jgi:nicotinamidase-related amidase
MEPNNLNSALLVMDMQVAILRNLPDAASIVSKVAKAIAAIACDNKIPVIYVTVGFRKGTPEISSNNKSFYERRERFTKIYPKEFLKIHPDILPQVGDVTVVKRRVCAFTGSDLEVILRTFGIQYIILTGVATSGVVLSTVRKAADKDYRIAVLSDGCADGDAEVHHILMTKVFPRQADVMTVEEWSKL